MLRKNVVSSVSPELVEVFPTKECYMRKNVAEEETEEGVIFRYDEVSFKTEETKEEIEGNFNKYWLIGCQDGLTVTLEERVDTLEELMEEIING